MSLGSADSLLELRCLWESVKNYNRALPRALCVNVQIPPPPPHNNINTAHRGRFQVNVSLINPIQTRLFLGSKNQGGGAHCAP